MTDGQRRPVAATIVAILNLLLFFPCVCGNCQGLMAIPASDNYSTVAPKNREAILRQERELETWLPGHRGIFAALAGASIVAGLVMLGSAIGLLTNKAWGPRVCIAGALLVLAVSLAMIYYQANHALPVQLALVEDAKRRRSDADFGITIFSSWLSLFLSSLVMVGYPLLALVVMRATSVRTFYTAEAAAQLRVPDQIVSDRESRSDEDRPPTVG